VTETTRLTQTRLLVAGLVVLPLLFEPEGGGDLVVKRLGLYLLATASAFLWMRHPVWPAVDVLKPALLFLGLSAASSLWAINPLSSVVELAPAVAGLVLLVISASTIDPKGFVSMCVAVAVGGGIVSIIGIAQYFDVAFTSLPSAGLPSATFGFRNLTASYLAVALPLSLVGIIGPRARWARWMSLGGSLLMSILLIYTRTRGAWVGAILAVAVVVGLIAKSRSARSHLRETGRGLQPFHRWAIILALVLSGLLSTLQENTSQAALQRFDEQKTSALTALQSTFEPGAGRGRLSFWANTVDLALDHPLLGVGLDNWEYAYPPYDRGTRITSSSEPSRPHNDLLWIASELGGLGLLVYGWLLFCAARMTLALVAEEEGLRSLIGIACVGSLVAFLGHGLFSFPREQPATVLLFWTALSGLAIAQRTSSMIRLPSSAGLLSAGLCLATLLVGWRHFQFDGPFRQGLGAALVGDWLSAQVHVDRALAYGVIDHRAAFVHAKASQEQSRWDVAETRYLRALEYHPNYANTHHNLAGVLVRKNQIERALSHFESAHRLRPSDASIQINRGNALIQAGRLDTAQVIFASLLNDPRAEHQAHAALGAIKLYRQNPNGAVPHLRRAVSLKPDFVEALNNLAIALEQAGRIPEAIEAHEAVARVWTGDPSYVAEIRSHLRTLRERID
tara:strand:- start:11617 stop:13650 length:2034 start_codon:yes stop_codon:yes gene_type:complete